MGHRLKEAESLHLKSLWNDFCVFTIFYFQVKLISNCSFNLTTKTLIQLLIKISLLHFLYWQFLHLGFFTRNSTFLFFFYWLKRDAESESLNCLKHLRLKSDRLTQINQCALFCFRFKSPEHEERKKNPSAVWRSSTETASVHGVGWPLTPCKL